MIFTPIYIAMTFIKSWRIRSLRSRLSEFLSGSRGVRFYETSCEDSPTQHGKLNPTSDNKLYVSNYTNNHTKRICNVDNMKIIDLSDWIACIMGMPLGSRDHAHSANLDLEVLFECLMEPNVSYTDNSIIPLETIGEPLAWKAGLHLLIVLKTNIENLSLVGFNFLGGELIVNHKLPIRCIETVKICGEPNKATDLSLRAPRNSIKTSLRRPPRVFQWSIHAELLRKLSDIIDSRNIGVEQEVDKQQVLKIANVSPDCVLNNVGAIGELSNFDSVSELSQIKAVLLDQSKDIDRETNLVKALPYNKILEQNTLDTNLQFNNHVVSENNISSNDVSIKKSPILKNSSSNKIVKTDEKSPVFDKTPSISPRKNITKSPERDSKLQDTKEKLPEEEVVIEKIINIQHNISPKKTKLNLDLKKGQGQNMSSSLVNISSQIQSVTTHKKVISTTVPVKTQSQSEVSQRKPVESSQTTSKGLRGSRPLVNTKSPNVIIYSESVVARENLEATLKKVLDCDRYSVQSVSQSSLCGGAWRGRAALVAVCGAAGAAAPLLLAHLLAGGRLLALCSDLLHTVLPQYKTAEIRENEIVQFSYDKWKSVKMKHHIFCYQASPAKKQFSTESDRQQTRYTGHPGHELEVQVLASEETWRTPSLLQATDLKNNGIAIFSQVHLESDPTGYLGEEGTQGNEARIEILHKILGDILGMHVKNIGDLPKIHYTRGYFLGNHVQKIALLDKWCPLVDNKRVQKLGSITIQWCLSGEIPVEPPSENFLPVYLYDCPDNFSTVEYFENLSSKSLGRQVIYSEVVRSTSRVVSAALAHGVAGVARRQTAGRGRAGSAWITVPGQAAISLQVWQKISPTLPLVQHASALAAVTAVRSDPRYESLNLRIKWPNDVYYGRDVKIGGTMVSANCMADDVYIEIGTGVNISNSVPTTCVNDIISEHNRIHGSTLPPVSVEWFLARYCSRLEVILDGLCRDNGVRDFLDEYYRYWIHDGEEIQVKTKDGRTVCGKIVRLDEAGWLVVSTDAGEVPVSPDGNTFDIMTGLIAPKL